MFHILFTVLCPAHKQVKLPDVNVLYNYQTYTTA